MLTPAEINVKGFNILMDGLGYADAVRFLKQFDNGSGDYTRDRAQWLDRLSLNEIVDDIQHATLRR